MTDKLLFLFKGYGGRRCRKAEGKHTEAIVDVCKSKIKPHHKAEDYFLDFISKVHKVTKLRASCCF